MKNMEKVIEKGVVVLGKTDKRNGGYTIFKNHNKDLVAKIKAVKLDEDSFSHWNHGEGCVIEQTLDNGQYLCKSKEDEYFTLDKETYDSNREGELLNKINNLYPVHKYWNENFGTFANGYERIDVIGRDDGRHDELGKVGYTSKRFNMSSGNGFSVDVDIEGQWSSIMFCWFNTDGNYVNRDYNIDVKKMANVKRKGSKDFLMELNRAIPDVEYQYAKDKWFTDDFVLKLNWAGTTLDYKNNEKFGFSISRLDRRAEWSDTYGKGRGSVKRLKRTTPSTKADIMERIQDVVDKICEHLDK